MKRPIGLALIFLCLWLFHGPMPDSYAGGKPQYLIKFATLAPDGSTWVKQMRKLDREIREKSGDRLGFRIYAGGIAGDELDVLKKIRIGQIHAAAFSGVGFGKILPMVRILDLPFLFRTYREVDLVHRNLNPFFTEQFRKKGFELLAWAEVGNVHLISKKPIRTVHDLSGLKVWTWSGDPIAKETFVAMGINPIPLAVTNVTTALNTGMIDTVYAPPLGALALQWQNYLNYMMALPLVHSTGAILISSRQYKKLPEDLASLLKKTVEKGMAELTTRLRDQSEEAVEILRKSGLTIIPVPEGEALREFHAVGVKVTRRLTGRIFSAELLDRVYALLKQD
ncbi:MAG: TRAP transporter substrate-binding protein DctP [Deltaproteobacteria bacterium]|nr:TRAP transporter substrate-binding protein DctP [Deltaproteobacteria bacterium]MBW2352951.1 TRAP transporter substrate-binding protein DctP [Deltaproteobacteria bacterium]HDZ90688.1 ABC transporter substrate-binding protein [Deltaproteobacteria bacterium]